MCKKFAMNLIKFSFSARISKLILILLIAIFSFGFSVKPTDFLAQDIWNMGYRLKWGAFLNSFYWQILDSQSEYYDFSGSGKTQLLCRFAVSSDLIGKVTNPQDFLYVYSIISGQNANPKFFWISQRLSEDFKFPFYYESGSGFVIDAKETNGKLIFRYFSNEKFEINWVYTTKSVSIFWDNKTLEIESLFSLDQDDQIFAASSVKFNGAPITFQKLEDILLEIKALILHEVKADIAQTWDTICP
jgi:hypothetical protein